MCAQKRGENCPMSPAAEMTLKARRSASFLVDREFSHTGSLMVAYQNVASAVGCSADWIRHFLDPASDRAKQPNWTVGHNLIAMYDAVCSRMEASSQKRRENIARREELINEIRQGRLRDREVSDQGCPVEAAAVAREAVPPAPVAAPTDEELEIPEFLRRAP